MPIVQQVNWILYLSTVGLRVWVQSGCSLHSKVDNYSTGVHLPTSSNLCLHCGRFLSSYGLLRVHYAERRVKRKPRLLSLCPFSVMRISLSVLRYSSPFPSTLVCKGQMQYFFFKEALLNWWCAGKRKGSYKYNNPCFIIKAHFVNTDAMNC